MKKTLQRVLLGVLLVVVLASALTFISSYNKKRNVGKGDEYLNPNVQTVKIVLDPWIGWKSLLDANGGLKTSSNSINAANGIKVEYIFEGDATFTLSGTSTGYYFRFRKTANITLNNFDATYNALNSGLWGFFDCDEDLTLTLTGTTELSPGKSYITCRNKDQCIYVFGKLTLKGPDTGSATLTVTCKSSSSGGILAEKGIEAASGYSFSKSGRTNNGDGTYSWTYTVTKTN